MMAMRCDVSERNEGPTAGARVLVGALDRYSTLVPRELGRHGAVPES